MDSAPPPENVASKSLLEKCVYSPIVKLAIEAGMSDTVTESMVGCIKDMLLYPDSACACAIMGDLWPQSVLLQRLDDGSSASVRVHVIDWEHFRLDGHPVQDVSQFLFWMFMLYRKTHLQGFYLVAESFHKAYVTDWHREKLLQWEDFLKLMCCNFGCLMFLESYTSNHKWCCLSLPTSGELCECQLRLRQEGNKLIQGDYKIIQDIFPFIYQFQPNNV